MQSVLDSLCRCFGAPVGGHGAVPCESFGSTHSAVAHNSNKPQETPPPATPDVKRRTRSLAPLQDKQWDALFADSNQAPLDAKQQQQQANTNNNTNQYRGGGGGGGGDVPLTSLEQAQAVAKAKLAANPSRYPPHDNNNNSSSSSPPHREQSSSSSRSSGRDRKHNNNKRSPKRKRSISHSRDDIFRSKKLTSPTAAPPGCHPGPASCGGSSTPATTTATGRNGGPNSSSTLQPNPFSRFLTQHPVLAQSLCFATPVKGSTEDGGIGAGEGGADNNDGSGGGGPPDAVNSVVSESNTLNTAEDTITSTLYYETTKLAGLTQKNPPMPLFNHFCVEERDEIRKIVATESHSSQRVLMDLYRPPPHVPPQPAPVVAAVELELEEEEELVTEDELVVQVPRSRHHHAAMVVDNDNCPPAMVNSSSDSSQRSHEQQQQQHQHHRR